MEFIQNLLKLFNELFKDAFVFEPLLYLFIGLCVFVMIVCIFESFIRGYYHK